MPWKDGGPLPFAQMQRRIGRKVLGPKILLEVPVVLVAFDLLEWGGEDVREQSVEWRRGRLEEAISGKPAMVASPLVRASSWEDLAMQRGQARERRVEGLMLKRLGSPYRAGRKRGDWWKWKIEPYSVDAVLIYAQPGNGRRASLFTDYTFGIWDRGELVPDEVVVAIVSDRIDHTWMFRHPRKTCEAFAAATLQNSPLHNQPVPEFKTLEELQRWFTPLVSEEEAFRDKGSPFAKVIPLHPGN